MRALREKLVICCHNGGKKLGADRNKSLFLFKEVSKQAHLSASSLSVGKNIAELAIEYGRNQPAYGPLVNFRVVGGLIKYIVEGKRDGIHFLGKVNPRFGLVDHDLTVSMVFQRVNDIDVVLSGSLAT